jgi:hypothetical protein
MEDRSSSENTLLDVVISSSGIHRVRFIEMIQKILDEEKGRSRFAHRFTTHMQTTLSKEHILRAIDSKQATLLPEMARHINRWQMDPVAVENEEIEEEWSLPLTGMDDWLAEVQKLRDYAELRHGFVWQHLQFDLGLGAPATLHVDALPGLLDVEVEGLSMPKAGDEWGARFFTRLPMRLSLRLAKGWRLAGWKNNSGPDAEGRFIRTGDTTLRPQLVFEPSHRPMFQSIELVGGERLRLVFFGIAGRTHHVEASTDLAEWQRLKTIAGPGSESHSIVVPLGNEPGRRFFRVVSDPE